MKHYPRYLDLKKILREKSRFLLGPRSTGKTTLIQKQLLEDVIVFDLLDRGTYRRLLKDPSLLDSGPQGSTVVIDEIQKLPILLDEVHRLIQSKDRRFLLTGSSARKLKRGAANLLAGRAWQATLMPLSFIEIEDFNLLDYLVKGGLPQVYGSKNFQIELAEYVSLYLREEVAAEALTRNIEAFSEFLDITAISNGAEINYQSFANDCSVAVNTIKNYFSILEDTLIGFTLPAFVKTKKRKAISRSKHYFFDLGLVNSIREVSEVSLNSPIFGGMFEHFIILEVRAYAAYNRKSQKLSYWRSVSQHEVDLIIGNEWAIEIKSSNRVQQKHLKGLKTLQEEGLVKNYLVVSMDEYEQSFSDNIESMHWKKFLERLWAGKMF